MKSVTGSQLKWIAVVTMFIDHIAASCIEAYAEVAGIDLMRTNEAGWVAILYLIMRCIGRIAFPIYCFLLVEGFTHTHSKWKYFGRLALFTFLSEIPFDLAFSHTFFDFQSQNVFFTLAFGLLTLIMVRELGNRVKKAALTVTLQILVVAVVCSIVTLMKTDYGMFGILAIVTMYYLKEKKTFGAFAGELLLTVLNPIEVFSMLNLIAIRGYRGEKGKQLKYFFYLFYPSHLVILAIITYFILNR